MAQASTILLSVTPKQLGKHLREVRRKKGLSLSEVARGAGLSRRELASYERGKVPIPESDLWVLAGSCGVDAAELVPQTTVRELPTGPTSMGDTVAQLRRSQDEAGFAPYAATLHRLQALPPGKRIPVKERELEAIATALGREPETIEIRLQQLMHVSPTEAARLREMILPPVGGRHRPRAIEAAPQFTEMAAEASGTVDVFEELARLPEPLPLPDPTGPLPDMLATPPPPDGAVELVDSSMPRVGVAASGFGTVAASTAPAGMPEPVLVDSAAAAHSAADAPPIDVAMRQSSDAWADWGKTPATPPVGNGGADPAAGEPFAASSTATPEAPPAWEPPAWQPGPDDASLPGGPPSFWEGTDDWAPPSDAPADVPADVPADPLAYVPLDPLADDWTSHEWPTDLSGEPAPADLTADASEFQADVVPPVDAPEWACDEWNSGGWPAPPETPEGSLPDADPDDSGPWAHEPDPEAISTGFYVDWGAPAADDEPPAWEALVGPETGAPAEFEFDVEREVVTEFVTEFGTEFGTEVGAEEGTPDRDDDEAAAPVADPLPPIMWRADGYDTPAPAAPNLEAPESETDPAPLPDPEPVPVEQFAVAGIDWQLGNALPLVEVRGEGALVMRRADERWALADLTTPQDCTVEVDVDFRSGPGLGVLFRASVDDAGRMSGYSFDIDPIYDGGGYLVRQWQSDRELWNPIARVSAGDPTSMTGALTVRLVLEGDHLVALVNGAEVLTVESLAQASAERGREAARGDRVGVQAWSSSDLVIETLRVAER
ncbi:MAG: helix-turn-helix domain-containing protein [Acidimicrobiia bacterium]